MIICTEEFLFIRYFPQAVDKWNTTEVLFFGDLLKHLDLKKESLYLRVCDHSLVLGERNPNPNLWRFHQCLWLSLFKKPFEMFDNLLYVIFQSKEK